jgi:hypothetical protein
MQRTIYADERLERFGQLVRLPKPARVRIFSHATSLSSDRTTASLPNFGRPFVAIIVRSSGAWFFILTARNNPLGLGFFNATSS